MTTPMAPTVWHRLEALLARLRPHREPLSLAADALGLFGEVGLLAWNSISAARSAKPMS